MKEEYPKKESRVLRLQLILIGVIAVVVLLYVVSLYVQGNTHVPQNAPVETLDLYQEGKNTVDADGALSGEYLSEVDARAEAYFPFTSHIEETLQFPELSGGCEIASLTAVLRSMGFELSITELADNYLNISYEGDFVNSYSGSPYDFGAGYPPVIVDCANAYLEAQGSLYRAQDITGSSFDELVLMMEEGYPVLVWTTIGMDQPFYTGIYVDNYEWYDNEHCVVFYGIEEGTVVVSDPLEGLIERDFDQFVQVYEACGTMAVVLR